MRQLSVICTTNSVISGPLKVPERHLPNINTPFLWLEKEKNIISSFLISSQYLHLFPLEAVVQLPKAHYYTL